MAEHERSLLALIARYEGCWNRRAWRDLRALWREDDLFPIWAPEESDRTLTDWGEIEAYWQACDALIERLEVRTEDHRFKPLAPGVVVGLWRLRLKASTWYGQPPRTRDVGADVRVTATFVEVAPGEWRFAHYHEAALGPLPFVRAAYARMAEEY